MPISYKCNKLGISSYFLLFFTFQVKNTSAIGVVGLRHVDCKRSYSLPKTDEKSALYLYYVPT